jgi:molybdopterin molybdotransferase
VARAVKLLAVEAARAIILARAAPLGVEEVDLRDAAGRVLAGDIAARRDQPPFAASAMDGWAVRVADTPGRLAIIGESAAGRGFPGVVGEGQAARIFTGAPMPAGADAVVIQEDARREGDAVEVPAVTGPRHIRPAGLDFKAGERLLTAGARLDPWRLALAAAAGAARLKVFRRPRVAILATGEEIVAPGAAAGPDQIYDSGTTTLTALTQSWGAAPLPLRRVGDDAADIAAAVEGAPCDLLVTLGGASVGDHDLVKPALARLGLRLEVESVAIRPGKPTWFGVLGDGRPVLGLPGNPASAMVCAELFLRPLVMALQGADATLALVAARCASALATNGERESWMRARLGSGPAGERVATPFGDQDSSLVSVFAAADALLRRPPLAPAIAPGDVVEILPLARL